MPAEQLPHLETFLLAAELSSFTGAARALKITQAAVSQRVQALEQDLGVPLFERQGGRVSLTDAGQQLYPYAQRILAMHEKARASVTGKKPPLSGELTLAASSIPGEHLLPGLLSAYQKRHPHITVRATVSNSHEVLQQLEQGKAALGLVGSKSDNPQLTFRTFASDTLVLIVPAGHAWSKRRSIALADLAQQSLILRESGSGSRGSLEQSLAASGKSLRDLHIALELGSNEAIKSAVARGLGAAIISTRAVKTELQSGKLHAVQIQGVALRRDIFAVWNNRRALSIPAQLFLDLVGSRRRPA